jgi:TetR/AcrR family transcriptional regulator
MQTPEFPVPTDLAPSEKDERTRGRLLCAAVSIFDRKGYSATSVREIAESAGVAKPALYYHFGSKEGLLVAILEAAMRELSAAMARAVERAGTARERLIALCEDVYGLFEKNVPVARVAHSVFLGPPDGVPTFDPMRFERDLRETLARIIADGQATGEIKMADQSDIAFAVMGALEVGLGRQLHPGFEPIGLSGLRRILDLIFDGLMNERRSQGADAL